MFDTYHPSVVFHAAAHKHVPLMEISPAEAVKNNVFGTKNLLTSAAEHGVERFVQLSTDKAVNPTNVMGCTKRLCEMLIQTFSRATSMTCVAVRFGNVLGSHGSVIPLFEEQIKRGGPVTITHPDIVRYFMTITEAAQLVLQAGGLAKGGSIYVLDMGEPVKIMDLANRLIRFYGYEPGVNMQVKVTGLRPGEKLYEELLMDSEQDKMAKTAHNKIFIAPPMQIDLEKFYTDLQRLKDSALHNSDEVVDVLQEMVPTYHPNRRVRAPTTPLWPPPATPRFSPGRRLHRSSGRQSIPPRRADLCTSVTASACWTLSFHWQPRSFLQFRWGWSRCGSSSTPRGRSFFKQRRVGKGKTHFNILKFRTMRGDTPHDVPTHLLKDADSYITGSGAFLRKTSLDELPQIYNILAGQMSVIGPRPALYNQYDLIEARDKVRANDIRPGLTGLAQVNGRDELPIDVKARYDGEYAAHVTFWNDVKIFFRSITYVFQRRGVVEGGTGAMNQTKEEKSSK